MSNPDLKPTRRQRPTVRRSIVDRLPPHSPEAEAAALGCVLMNPKLLTECMSALGDHESFYDLRHQEIYKAMVAVSEAGDGRMIDIITLVQRLGDSGMLEQVGGAAYVSGLQDVVTSTANLSYYTDFIREKHHLRRMIHACTEAVSKIYEHGGEVDEVLDEIERDVLAVRRQFQNNSTVGIKALVREALDGIETLHSNQGAVTGLQTGFTDLDRHTNGLHPGEMTIIAAMPSCGKTSLAMNIAENVALDSKQPVGVFSLEMSAVSLVTRMLCSRARINLRRMPMAERDFPVLATAAAKLAGSMMFIEDISDMTVTSFRAKARRMVQEHGVKLLIVDYLQLMSGYGGSRKVDSRAEDIEAVSNGIKACAKELKVPILALSQLTPNDKGSPRLRGSNSIGQDADGIWMLEPGEDTPGNESVAVDLWIRKQRNGPRNECVKITFLKGFTRFESASRVADEDVPENNGRYRD